MAKTIKKIHLTQALSTQEYAKQHYAQIDPSVLICIYADEQTLGKGTNGKAWYSPKGVNIYATFVFFLPTPFRYLANLSQLLSLSLIQVLKKKGFEPSCKWPNDVFIDGKKVAGILTELSTTSQGVMVYSGIGINVNMEKEALSHIDQSATSLFLESHIKHDLEALLDALVQQYQNDLFLLQKEGFSPFVSLLNNTLLYKGKKCRLLREKEELIGSLLGIDEEGRLLFQTQEGVCLTIQEQERLLFL